VLAPGTDAEGAAMLAGRLRERLGRVQFAGDCVSATVGWAVFPDEGATPHSLLARADEALLEGKLIPRFAAAPLGARLVASQPSALPGV
jgi:GGDEF domain-containing protein